ncbi:MAG: hypothetical protein V1493_02090 [Candidatus Diapherotrites archaeon]
MPMPAAKLRSKARTTPKGRVQPPRRPALNKRILKPKDGPRQDFTEQEIREAFAKRAIRMGAGSDRQIREMSGLPEHKVKELRDNLRFAGYPVDISLKKRQVIQAIEEGELNDRQISKRVGVSSKQVSEIAHNEKIAKFVPGTQKPPMVVARSILKYEVLTQLKRKAKAGFPARAFAEAEGTIKQISNWYMQNPSIQTDLRNFNGGRIWKKAQGQLKDWIAEWENYFGQKYDPEQFIPLGKRNRKS